jgi:uncharacterized protein YhfF
MRVLELGAPGPLRDRLNALARAGRKVATVGHWQHDYVDEGEALDFVGERQLLVDSAGQGAAVVEIVRVETPRFVDVSSEFARAEGEGFGSIGHWRDGHRRFWADQGITVHDDDTVVCVWFRLGRGSDGELARWADSGPTPSSP